jgi:Bacterial protein of unknown function (DUF885)
LPDDGAFTSLAERSIADILAYYPDWATELGEHRHDSELRDDSAVATEAWRQVVGRYQEEITAVEVERLGAEARVDASILSNAIEKITFQIDDLNESSWNPLLANPGRAIYDLTARDFAPAGERLRAIAGRLEMVPTFLATARANLGPMPRVHLETALGQFAGTANLVIDEVDRLLEVSPTNRAEVDAVRPAALEALATHRAWLADRLATFERDNSFRDPRLGAELFSRKLQLTLDTQSDAASILERAEEDFARVTEEITEAAARYLSRPPSSPGLVRDALDTVAADTLDNDTILEFARSILPLQIAFVEDNAIVTTHADPYAVIAMPEIDRGVAVAYCDSPGPLETAEVATLLAVSPTPTDWSESRVRSFFREYNRHMVHNLMAHEAMPGHMLQLQHSRRFVGSSPARAAFYSGSFVEGWAVYAERVMVEFGYPGGGNPGAVRLQQLKMQLRMILNAILDARVHAGDLNEDDAMRLMIDRGFQEEGEAAGKWRRTLLTSAQLSTYYVGYSEVSDLVEELRWRHPDWAVRTVHDRLLSHGSPPPRHLAALIG